VLSFLYGHDLDSALQPRLRRFVCTLIASHAMRSYKILTVLALAASAVHTVLSAPVFYFPPGSKTSPPPIKKPVINPIQKPVIQKPVIPQIQKPLPGSTN
jgi:hypothetical protein